MFLKPFAVLSKQNVGEAGGKGASLGELTKAGFPVPPGFVLLASAFDQFLQETGLMQEIESQLSRVHHNDIASVERASAAIRDLIHDARFPVDLEQPIVDAFDALGASFVAVRSSATAEDSSVASWAGELESYLNTPRAALLEHVKKCWASLFTPRAIVYRDEKGMRNAHVSVAVVIQAMVDSDISGVAFTVHPVTEDPNQLIIEACWGLGELIVSGQVTPDTYVIGKREKEIIDAHVSEQKEMLIRGKNGNERTAVPAAKQSVQKINATQIRELTDLCLAIEKHYGFPCDIEWAMADGKFFIVQSRPITTLTEKSSTGLTEGGTSRTPRVLSKIFSRERPYFYFRMWNDSDRLGFEKFVGHKVRNSLFLREGGHNKGSVWYDLDELNTLNVRTAERIKADPDLFPRLLKTLDKEWNFIGPLLMKKKKLETIDDFAAYYDHLTKWWSAMTLVFNIPGIETVSQDIRDQALARRVVLEKYSDEMHKIYLAFWHEYFPAFADLAFVLMPEEAVALGKNNLSEQDIEHIRERLQGVALFNEHMYLPREIDAVLEKEGVQLEKMEVKHSDEIKGMTAYPGLVRGRVRHVRFRELIPSLQTGEVLVTEMTDPDFVVAMKRACAVVTDEGGVTCHAAIVARELKKPCVIGTKIATQVLQDGDEVEVDATNGVVRILKKA